MLSGAFVLLGIFAIAIYTYLYIAVIAIINITAWIRKRSLIKTDLHECHARVASVYTNYTRGYKTGKDYFFHSDEGHLVFIRTTNKVKLEKGDAGMLQYVVDKGKNIIVDFIHDTSQV